MFLASKSPTFIKLKNQCFKFTPKNYVRFLSRQFCSIWRVKFYTNALFLPLALVLIRVNRKPTIINPQICVKAVFPSVSPSNCMFLLVECFKERFSRARERKDFSAVIEKNAINLDWRYWPSSFNFETKC